MLVLFLGVLLLGLGLCTIAAVIHGGRCEALAQPPRKSTVEPDVTAEPRPEGLKLSA